MSRKNKDLESELRLTVSAEFGLVAQDSFFGKNVSSKDLSGYYLLKKGDFAYNKSYSKGYPWGAVKRLDLYDEGVLSSLYIVFRPTEMVDSDFLAIYYDTGSWYTEVSRVATEGARNHGLLNVSPIDFMKTNICIPNNINEQTNISKIMVKINSYITLHHQKSLLLKKVKSRFMSKVFSMH